MKSKPSFNTSEANEIVMLIKEKLKAEPTKQKGIRAKIRKIGFYASDYGFIDGYTVEQFLSVAKIVGSQAPEIKNPSPKVAVTAVYKIDVPNNSRSNSDESYIIDLCDEVLKLKAIRQHRFDFLKGDTGKKLPVDAYYPDLKLVIEYRERQHTEEVKFFDRKQTVSGIGRGEQRKLYDQRRRDVLPLHNLALIELDYEDFDHNRSKRLMKNHDSDIVIIKIKLAKWI